MNTKVKEVTLENKLFRIGKMDPMRGVWVLSQLTSASMKVDRGEGSSSDADNPFEKMEPQERGDALVQMLWVAAGPELEEDRYRRIQELCLEVCSSEMSESSQFEAVIRANGKLTNDLEPKTVQSLVLMTLQFNLSRVFQGDAGKAAVPASISVQPLQKA